VGGWKNKRDRARACDAAPLMARFLHYSLLSRNNDLDTINVTFSLKQKKVGTSYNTQLAMQGDSEVAQSMDAHWGHSAVSDETLQRNNRKLLRPLRGPD
jgi:hypothetical protein